MKYDLETVQAIVNFLYQEEERRCKLYEVTHESQHEIASDVAGEIATLVHTTFLCQSSGNTSDSSSNISS